MLQVDVRYTRSLVVAAVNAFYRRTLLRGFGWSGWASLIVTLIAFGFLVLRGDRSWVVGFIGGGILIIVLILAGGYIAHYRNTTGRFDRMTKPEARFVFSDEGFTITSDAGTSTLSWASVREVWAFPDYWLILLSKAQFLTLPIEGVSADIKTLIGSKTTVT